MNKMYDLLITALFWVGVVIVAVLGSIFTLGLLLFSLIVIVICALTLVLSTPFLMFYTLFDGGWLSRLLADGKSAQASS